MPISLFYILLALLLLATLVLWLCRWRNYRAVVRLSSVHQYRTIAHERATGCVTSDAALLLSLSPCASIIVPSLNDGWWIERYLHYWLQQRGRAYEVIVADASDKEDETKNVVTRLQAEHRHLRYVAVPMSHRNIDLMKLALTLGVRAARAPWVLFTRADCAPQSSDWLLHLSTHFDESTDVVMAYANFDDSVGAPGRRAVYQRAKRFLQRAEAVLGGAAVGADGANLALRREWFLSEGGFVDSLKVPYGECALLVDARAQPHRVAIELHHDAAIRQQLPDAETLRELRRHESRVHARLFHRHRWVFCREGFAIVAHYVAAAVFVLYVLSRSIHFFGGEHPELRELGLNLPVALPVYQWTDLVLDALALVLLVVLLVAPLLAQRRWMRALGERNFGMYTYFYDWLQPWRRSW